MWLLGFAGTAALASGVAAATFLHPRSPWGRPVVRTGGAHITLTFDDGPDPTWTPQVLSALERRGLRASFFVLGDAVAAHPGLVREVAARGHGVEVHGAAHDYAFFTSPARLSRDVGAVADRVADLTGRRPAWFRPPYGGRPLWCDGTVAGLRLVTWSWAGGDWAGGRPPRTGPGAGDIVLLHDGPTPEPAARARTLAWIDTLPGGVPLPSPA